MITKGIYNPFLTRLFNELEVDSNYAALQVMPAEGVAAESATLPVSIRENDGTADDTHANGGAFNRISSEYGSDTYACVDRGLEHPVTERDYKFFGSFLKADTAAMYKLKRYMLLNREIRVKTKVQDAAVYTGSAYFEDVSSSDPWTAADADIRGLIERLIDKVRANSGCKADSIVFNGKVKRLIGKNSAIISYFPGASSISTAMMIKWLQDECELKNVIIADASYNIAAEGQDYANGDVWDEDYINVFKRADRIETGGYGQTLIWNEMALATGDVSVSTYENVEIEAMIHRARLYEDNKVYGKEFMAMAKIQ